MTTTVAVGYSDGHLLAVVAAVYSDGHDGNGVFTTNYSIVELFCRPNAGFLSLLVTLSLRK